MTSVNNATHVTRDLNINRTQLTDAGVYVCVENVPGHGVQQNSSAQLIVLGILTPMRMHICSGSFFYRTLSSLISRHSAVFVIV